MGFLLTEGRCELARAFMIRAIASWFKSDERAKRVLSACPKVCD